MDRLVKNYQKLTQKVYTLYSNLYGPYQEPSPTYNWTSPQSPQTFPSSVTINNYQSPSPWFYYPPSVTNVYTCSSCHDHSCKKCKEQKEKEKNNLDWYFGALLTGVLTIGTSYLITKEFIKWQEFHKVQKKVQKLQKQLNTDSSTTEEHGLKVSMVDIPNRWNLWSNYYRSTCRLYNIAKVAFLVSGLLIGLGLMDMPIGGRQLGYWSLIGSGSYLAIIMTLYHSVWKRKEKNLMDKLIQECNMVNINMAPSAPPM